MTAECESNIWQAITLVALDRVLAVVTLLSAHLLVQEVSKGGWESNQRSSGIQDNTSLVKLSSSITERDGVEVNLPVCLTSEWQMRDLALVRLLIDSSECNLGLLGRVRKLEGKYWLIQQFLVEHLIEWWWDLVDRDGVESKTQDTIKTAEGKSETWLLNCLSKQLVLNLEVADSQGVLRNISAQATRAVADLERSSVLLVCGRGGCVVLGVEVTGDRAALRTWNPEVGASGIEDDLESLWWCTESDLREVCGTLVMKCTTWEGLVYIGHS